MWRTCDESHGASAGLRSSDLLGVPLNDDDDVKTEKKRIF